MRLRFATYFRSLTPGLPSFRNSMPAFSSVRVIRERVEVRAPISPLNDSMRRIVLMATWDFAQSCVCSHPRSARAALSWRPVIKGQGYHLPYLTPNLSMLYTTTCILYTDCAILAPVQSHFVGQWLWDNS